MELRVQTKIKELVQKKKIISLNNLNISCLNFIEPFNNF